MRWLLVLALIAAAVVLVAAVRMRGGDVDHATVTIHHSHFVPEALTARAGEPITITIRNDDPIDHEWIVGTADVHQRHRTGTEPFHATRPTEVTVPALSSRTTTVTFADPGDYQYICHLPGHEEYGMVGVLHVVAGG